MTTISKADQPMQHQVLDPCLLGRPVHLLHVFAAQLREDLAGALRLPMNRRYWGTFQIDAVQFSRVEGAAPQGRWLNFLGPQGCVGFALERKVLLGVLNHCYGRKSSKPAEPPQDPATVRVTATEERLAVVLGQQLASALVARVADNLAALGKPVASAGGELAMLPGVPPARGGWIVSVALSDVAAGLQGEFWFALDKTMMTDVLHGLLPARPQAKTALKSVRPLASQLQVKLEGRLVSKEVQLGTLFDLRVGDVIPISMSRTDVLLSESRLFTAAVSEHKGKLCLTSFEDAE